MGTFALKLGQTVPNFACKTTSGTFMLHEFINQGQPYTILMTHPKDFTPVCTTELGKAESLLEEFNKRGVKLLAISGDSIEDHEEWSKDILHCSKNNGTCLSFPIVADEDLRITKMLGLMDPNDDLPGRGLIVMDKHATVRLALLYPTTIGRNFDEVIRIIDALRLVDEQGVVTPVNWKPGDKVILPPNISNKQGEMHFNTIVNQTVPSGKDYMRYVHPRK